MKRRLCRRAGLLLTTCLIAATAGAREPKPGSMAELAREIAERLPHYPGMKIYVAMPAWAGHATHYLLCRAVGGQLGRALSAAEPADKIYAPAQAAGILAKAGFQPLDVYFTLRHKPYANYAARMIGAEVAVSTEIKRRGKGILLTVEATQAIQDKRFAKRRTFLDSPQLRTLLSAPDVPVKDSAGVYEAGVGGVGEPRCVDCPSPAFPKQAARDNSSWTVMVLFTIGANGRVSNAKLLPGVPIPEMGQAALEAVCSWRFKPAPGPGAKPVPVRMLAVISFRMAP